MSILVVRDRKGKLAFQCRWRGHKKWIGWGTPDTKENRGELEAYAHLIAKDLERGALLRDAIQRRMGKACEGYFPDEEGQEAGGDTLADYWLRYERYMRTTDLAAVTRRARVAYMTKLIVPRFGTRRLVEITPGMLNEFRQELGTVGLKGRPLKQESVKAIVNNHFRSVYTWALTEHNFKVHSTGGRPLLSAFEQIKWPKQGRYYPAPLDEKQQSAVLAWFHERARHWYEFVAFLLMTGCRPSEAAGLTEGTVDLAAGVVTFRRSRVERVLREHTKTAAAEREITLFPDLLAILQGRKVVRLAPVPDAPFFVDSEGREIDQHRFSTGVWARCLASLEIGARGVYACRDTFISHALTAGRPPKAVAEYCGTSLAMIDRHYGKYMGKGGLEPFGIGGTSNRTSNHPKKGEQGRGKGDPRHE